MTKQLSVTPLMPPKLLVHFGPDVIRVLHTVWVKALLRTLMESPVSSKGQISKDS